LAAHDSRFSLSIISIEILGKGNYLKSIPINQYLSTTYYMVGWAAFLISPFSSGHG
jgi:hypothetical protein